MTRTSKRRSVVDARSAPTNRLNVTIPSSAYDRLNVHALLSRKSPGEVVAELIDEHLREYRVQRNPTARVMSEVSVDSSGQARESEAVAA